MAIFTRFCGNYKGYEIVILKKTTKGLFLVYKDTCAYGFNLLSNKLKYF